jgi:exodeoxyribonuclease V alpha subunit
LSGPQGDAIRFDFVQRLLREARMPDEARPRETAATAALMTDLIDRGRAGAVVGRAGEFKPLIVSGNHLYLQRMLHLEDQFVLTVRRRLAAEVPGWTSEVVEAALSEVLTRPPPTGRPGITLNDQQREAVRIAVQSPITIISGGPGTGKTTIVVSILRVLSRLGVGQNEIALAAPTGKAANRMLEAIQADRQGVANPIAADQDFATPPEPRTLHRLLGYSPSSARFYHHENNRLAEKIVIVDEASMIDLALMERLVRSLRDDGRLILLGDARQLPSVEAGAVLRDLLRVREEDPRGGPPAVILEKSHRMRDDDLDGRNLLSVARKIDQGEPPQFNRERTGDDVVVQRGSVKELKFQGVEFIACRSESPLLDEFLELWEKEGGQAQPHLDDLIDHVYALSGTEFTGADLRKLRELFDYWGGFRVLCVTRVLPTGSDRINELFHRRALDRLDWRPGDDRFLPGEAVMMQVNDYRRMLYNGDQGLIVNVVDQVEARPQPMAVFRRSEGFTAFHLESLRSSLVLAYAMTVHKAQGSEFDRVALFLPDRDLPINTREILYTALTRARKSVVILGNRDIFESGITRTIERDSGIVEKLRA